jgi:hypothetical protein
VEFPLPEKRQMQAPFKLISPQRLEAGFPQRNLGHFMWDSWHWSKFLFEFISTFQVNRHSTSAPYLLIIAPGVCNSPENASHYSQWPRGLRHEQSLPATTLRWWIRIPREASTSVWWIAYRCVAIFNVRIRLHNLTYGEDCEFQQESHGCNSRHIHVLIYIFTTCFDIWKYHLQVYIKRIASSVNCKIRIRI